MDLYGQYLESERSLIMNNNVRLIHLGRRARLPESVLSRMDKLIADSAGNTGLKLCLALNYGGRAEMVDAVRRIAADVQSGELSLDEVNESAIDNRLYTAGLPDPDLLIRTSGEQRISNFLLWQISYSELHVSEACWPDFSTARFHDALRDYASRDRRFGGLTSPVPSSTQH
jgi:undecaprenyl diphosphate synthase